MYSDAPEAGLASLLASRGRNGDSILVHMAPQELKGLQALAMAHGGELTVNPETGLYEANFLKKILPMVAGALLGPAGLGLSSFAAAATVGLGYGLIEGDLKKGLMAGLGAYSGSSLTQGLKAAAAAPTAEQVAAEKVLTTQGAQKAAEQVGLTESATQLAKPSMLATGPKVNPFTGAPVTTPTLAQPVSIGTGATALNAPAMAATPSFGTAPVGLAAVNAAPMAALASSAAPAAATGPLAGINALFRPEGQRAFMEALGGGYKTPLGQSLSKYAVLTGAMDALTPEPQEFKSQAGEDIVYIPGERNPMYGMGRQYGYFQPGQYFKRTPQGLIPYNPYQRPPGMAMGGPVQPDNEGYVDQTTGMESYANGGFVGVDPRSLVPDRIIGDDRVTKPVAPDNVVINPYAPTTAPVAPPAAAPATAADAIKRYEQMVYGPAPAPVNTQPVMDYLANLNKRVQRPLVYPYPGADPTRPPPPPPPPPPGPPPGPGRDPIRPPPPYPPGPPPFPPPGPPPAPPPPGPPPAPPKKPDDDDNVLDKAKNKFMDWFRTRFTDPMGIIGTAIGFTGVGPLGTLVWDKMSPTLKEFFIGTKQILTPEEEAAIEAETKLIAEKEAQNKNVAGGGGGGRDGSGGGGTGFGGGSFGSGGTGATRIDKRGVIKILPVAQGGRIKAMQAGGMTAPNPYGAAVGEDYNFGFSGGGETEYAAAGKLLEGPGDGMSDDIPAVIRGKGVQRAALADGEFVIPADVVSHLGNGSTKAGAKKLHQMMDRIRQARTGRSKQAPEVKTDKYLPA